MPGKSPQPNMFVVSANQIVDNAVEQARDLATTRLKANDTLATDITNSSPQKICYADKCRILLAKGILENPVPCAKNRNLCQGCILERTRKRKTATVEIEILEANTPNHILAPILDHILTPTSIKEVRRKLNHLPTLNHNNCDDSIFGVLRYVANSLGLRLNNATSGSIEEPMNSIQVKQSWRKATFSCKCQHTTVEQQIYGDRAFCTNCSFIIPHQQTSPKQCRGCLLQDGWGPNASFCLACQFPTVIFRNRFHYRYTTYIEIWLPTLATDSDNDTVDPPSRHTKSTQRIHATYEELQRLRQKSLQNSFTEIRSRSSPAENLHVIENITVLQRNIRNSTGCKRDIASLQSDAKDSFNSSNIDNHSSKENKMLKQ